MRTLKEHLTCSGLSVTGQELVAAKATSMRWIVDDRGRVAALNSHPVALWASAFDQPITAILELGLICIEERPKNLILALHPSKVQRVTLVGTFYYLADHNSGHIIICSDCGLTSAYYTLVRHRDLAYQLLEEMIVSASTDMPLIACRLKMQTERRSIRYARPRSSPAALMLLDN